MADAIDFGKGARRRVLPSATSQAAGPTPDKPIRCAGKANNRRADATQRHCRPPKIQQRPTPDNRMVFQPAGNSNMAAQKSLDSLVGWHGDSATAIAAFAGSIAPPWRNVDGDASHSYKPRFANPVSNHG
jgi:hypothetical protein